MLFLIARKTGQPLSMRMISLSRSWAAIQPQCSQTTLMVGSFFISG